MLHARPRALWEKIQNHPLPWSIGLLAAILSLATPVWQAFVEPDISIDPAVDESQPFAFPFIVDNRSWLFDMSQADFFCEIAKFRTEDGSEIAGVTFLDNLHLTISTGKPGLFKCRISVAPTPKGRSGVVEGRLFASVRYRTIFSIFERRSPPTEFTWFPSGNASHWVKGSRNR